MRVAVRQPWRTAAQAALPKCSTRVLAIEGKEPMPRMDALDALRRFFADFTRHWRAARPQQRRAWLAATSAAICLFALTGTLVAFGGRSTSTDLAAAATPTDTIATTDTAGST